MRNRDRWGMLDLITYLAADAPRQLPLTFGGFAIGTVLLGVGLVLQAYVLKLLGVFVLLGATLSLAKVLGQVVRAFRSGNGSVGDPVTRLWNQIVNLCFASRVRELHLSPGLARGEREGVWSTLLRLPVETHAPLVNRLKETSTVDTATRTKQEGQLPILIRGCEVMVGVILETTPEGVEEVRVCFPESLIT